MPNGHRLIADSDRFLDDHSRGLCIAAFARAHHDVMTTQELVDHGLAPRTVARWVENGRLFRKHRGVYAFGREALTEQGRVYAAVRACGEHAAASHRAAAFLHEVLLGLPARIDVTVARTGARPRRGIRPCASLTLLDQDVTTVDGIPCTTVARTLVDLGDREPRRNVEIAFERAELLGLFDRRPVEDVIARAGRRRGARIASDLLAIRTPPSLTDTEIEELFITVVRPANLRPPVTQQWIVLDDGGPAIRVDFLWPHERLIVETDGRAAHGTLKAFEDDRRRDQRLMAAGYTVVRFTWRQLLAEPERVRGAVRNLLARLAPP
jgi:very-short-patch-repair endonuclease